MNIEYGTINFYYKKITVQEKKICTKFHLFKRPEKIEKIVNKTKDETEKHIWKRINKCIQEDNLKVINIEAIVVNKFPARIPMENIYISNDNRGYNNIVGYRIFYKKIVNILNIQD